MHKNLTNTEKLSLPQHNFWQLAVLKLEICFSTAAMVEISLMNPLCSHSSAADLRAAAYTSAQSPQCLYLLIGTKTLCTTAATVNIDITLLLLPKIR